MCGFNGIFFDRSCLSYGPWYIRSKPFVNPSTRNLDFCQSYPACFNNFTRRSTFTGVIMFCRSLLTSWSGTKNRLTQIYNKKCCLCSSPIPLHPINFYCFSIALDIDGVGGAPLCSIELVLLFGLTKTPVHCLLSLLYDNCAIHDHICHKSYIYGQTCTCFHICKSLH